MRWIRYIKIPNTAFEKLNLIQKDILHVPNFFQTEFCYFWTGFNERLDTVVIETWALSDEKAFQLWMGLEKVLPRRWADKEWA